MSKAKLNAKNWENVWGDLKHKKPTKENLDRAMDRAMESALFDVKTKGVAAAYEPPDWVWTPNKLFESFLVSFAKKGSNKFKAVAVRPANHIKGADGKYVSWITLQTPVMQSWQDAKEWIVRSINAYHKSIKN